MSPRSPTSSRRAFAALCVSLAVCALWLPLRGAVIYEVSDLNVFVVPEIELHLHGDHGAGPALWDPQVELGRPAFHSGGLSQAYWLTHALSWVIDDAWQLHSALVLATMVLGGLFAWGFFRTLELHPWTSAACALGFAFSSFHGRAGANLCYVAGSVWTMGLAWALARTVRNPAPGNALFLAFIAYSAILASYPQQLLWAAWFLLCLALALFPPPGRRLRCFVALGLGAAIGVLCAAPFLLDLLAQARESSRVVFDETLGGPRLETARDYLRLRELADPLWNGRDVRYFLWGASFTPFFGAGLLLAVARVRTPLVRFAAGFALATLLFSLSAPLYRFGVRHLGIGLSVFRPFAAATPAIFLLAALGFDHGLRVPGGRTRAGFALVLPLLLAVASLAEGRAIDAWNAGTSLALALGAALVLVRPSWPLFATAALASACHYGVASLPEERSAQVTENLALNEPVVAEVHRRAPGARFAWVGDEDPMVLAPNTEQLYGVSSIHSYDQLPSRRYQAWVRRISERGMTRGRFFRYMAGEQGLESQDFARSGVRLVLAFKELTSPALRASGVYGRLRLYDVVAPAPLQSWLPLTACTLEPDGASLRSSVLEVGPPVVRRARSADRLDLTFEPRSEPGILWLSQQYHASWRAWAQGEPLDTLPVDGFWQGVRVPAGVSEVALEFRPWLRWWWAPQLFFVLVGAVMCLRRGRRP